MVGSVLGDVDRSSDTVIDYSDGERFPWWLWLANTGHTRRIADDGVTNVRMVIRNAAAFLEIETVPCTWRVELPAQASNKKMIFYQYDFATLPDREEPASFSSGVAQPAAEAHVAIAVVQSEKCTEPAETLAVAEQIDADDAMDMIQNNFNNRAEQLEAMEMEAAAEFADALSKQLERT